MSAFRYKDGKPINQVKIKRMRVHLNHALEIRDVCPEDSGVYMVVLRNRAASLEKRLNLTLLINGNSSTEVVEGLLTHLDFKFEFTDIFMIIIIILMLISVHHKLCCQ